VFLIVFLALVKPKPKKRSSVLRLSGWWGGSPTVLIF